MATACTCPEETLFHKNYLEELVEEITTAGRMDIIMEIPT